MWIALASGILAFLIVPLVIPFESSGTTDYRQSAGPRAEFANLAGVDVHLEQSAYFGECNCQPPVLVLMHGFGASTFSWREVIGPLSRYGDVIAYDRPGFGFTQRPTSWNGVDPYGFEGNFLILDELIAKFAKDREVFLVGHSAGSQLAAEYARVNPGKVSGLILVDPAILTTGGGPAGLDWIYDIPQIQKLGPLLVRGIASSGLDILNQSFVDKSKITADVIAGYTAPLKVKDWELGFWNFVTAPRENQLRENLDSLDLPILLITGDQDTIVPTSDTVELQDLLPNSSLSIIENAGHLPHEEQPEAFMNAIAKSAKGIGLTN